MHSKLFLSAAGLCIAVLFVVPPSELLVTRAVGDAWLPVDVLAPLNEGDELSLACEAVGGAVHEWCML